ncbi:hypothetical protein BC835DRAFT_1311746 [Cytidiella melzeri]|nr:hypothetical protein BC835DRAFT_1311746 [Cytidiella melzeri]
MAKTKKKAQVAQASEDDHSDADNPQAPHATGTTRSGVTCATTSHTTRRVRNKSAKQTSLDYEVLLKRAAKLERENKALKRSKAKEPGMRENVQVGAAATIQPANNDKSDAEDTMVRQDNDSNYDSPEEEDNDIIIYKSPFQSKGTVEATKKLSRRVNNSKAVTPVDMNKECLPAVPAVRAQDTSRSFSPLSQLLSRSHAYQHSRRSSQASAHILRSTRPPHCQIERAHQLTIVTMMFPVELVTLVTTAIKVPMTHELETFCLKKQHQVWSPGVAGGRGLP